MKPFKAIAAMSENRVIGNGNSIPWHLPEDFKFFKKTTMGHILLMGRKTFESIGRPLPGRETVVLSRSGFHHDGVKTIQSMNELAPSEHREIFVCGGAQVYSQLLPQCSELYLTHVNRKVDGDAYFPSFENLFDPVETLQETKDFRIVRYQRNLQKAAQES